MYLYFIYILFYIHFKINNQKKIPTSGQTQKGVLTIKLVYTPPAESR